MDVTPLIPAGRQILESYDLGRFRISGQWLSGPILVFPDRVLAWSPADPSALTAADFGPVADAESAVDLLLLGMGDRGQRLSSRLREDCRALGFTIEGMATGPACRTYNVLMAEGRRVAAALLPLTEG